MASEESAPSTTTPSLSTYREFLLSTLKNPVDAALRTRLLDESLPISEVWAQIRGNEDKDWPNDLRWNTPADALGSLAQNLIVQHKQMLDKIAALKEGEHTWANTIGATAEEERLSQPLSSSLDFVSDVSPDKAVRDAANVAKEALQAYAVDASARVDVYKSIKAFAETEEAKALTGERARLLKYVLRDFRRDGMELSEEARARLVEIRKRMSAISIQFHANVGEVDTQFYFTPEQLAGLSASQLEQLTAGEGEHAGKRVVTLKTPDYMLVMQFCSVEDTRRQLEFAYNTRCIAENTPIIEELVALRAEQAKLLGYATHADYVLETRMAKTKETVLDFLTTLSARLDPLYDRDVAAVLATKKAQCEKNGTPFDGVLHPWDRAYYSRIWEEEAFQLDHEALKGYFPLETVTKGLFKICERLLAIRFEQVDPAAVHAWHEDVKMYIVTDVAPGREGTVLGHAYMDLHPRAGKYSHAAVFPLVSACKGPDGRVIPAAALVTNFPRPTADKPSLLSHNDVVTYFHELGHLVHQISSQTEMVRFSGTSVARDAVETPSQQLENWCYEKESLLLMSGHYKDGSKPTDEVIASLNRAKTALAGMFNKRQLVFGLVDMRMHTSDKVNTAELYSKIMDEVQHCKPTPGTNMIASFGHLAGGYDAGYYGYLWSEVFALDIFYTKFYNNLFDQGTGLKYRDIILASGDSEDFDVLLERFLGRAPNQDAFLKMKGL